MAKKLLRLALRLLLLNIVSIFLMLFLVMWQNDVYLWIITSVLTFALLYFVWRDAESAGQKDIHNDKIIRKRIEQEGYTPSGTEGRLFRKWFGFAAGLLAQVPALLLLVASCILNGRPWGTTLNWVAKMWYISYYKPLFGEIFIPNAVVIMMFFCAILFSVISGLAYLHGPAVDRKVETVIERSKAKKPKRVQDEWAAEKKRKAGQKRFGR